MLIAEDGLMLRPVILEYPMDILHVGAQDQIAHKDHNTNHTLQHVAQPHGQGGKVAQQAHQGGRQQNKESHREADTQYHRQGHQGGGRLFAAQVLVQPLLKFRGFLRLLLVLRHEGCGVHQRLDAVGHGGTEVKDAPDEGHTQHRMLVLDEHPLLYLLGQFPVRLADHHGLFLRPQHHDAFDEGLTADHGLIRRVAGTFRLF